LTVCVADAVIPVKRRLYYGFYLITTCKLGCNGHGQELCLLPVEG